MLIAVLTGLGLVVTLMFVAWWSSRVFLPTPSVPVTIGKAHEEVGGGGRGDGTGVRPVEQDFVEPASDEVPQAALKEDQSYGGVFFAPLQPEIMAEIVGGEPSSSVGVGKGPSRGDKRGAGPPGPGDQDGVPPWERWEIRFDPQTIAEYSRQLDFFQIELAVAGGGSAVVTYVTNVSNTKPTVRTGSPKDEKRLRFMHRSGALREADRKLVNKAGVDPTDKVVVQFYSQPMYETLRSLENVQMGSRPLSEVRQTSFGVRETAGKYEFFVISQEYR
jgi:hypothetical protein